MNCPALSSAVVIAGDAKLAARLEMTAIYANAISDEERNLARRAWNSLELVISEKTKEFA